MCWVKGIRPEEAFEYHPDLGWFHKCVVAASEMAIAVAKQKITPYPSDKDTLAAANTNEFDWRHLQKTYILATRAHTQPYARKVIQVSRGARQVT